MDVKIAFGIDLESVPSHVSNMLGELYLAEIERSIRIVQELIELSKDNVEMSVSLIEQARNKLASADRVLGDCQMILKGYCDTKNPKKEASPTPPAETNVGSPDAT